MGCEPLGGSDLGTVDEEAVANAVHRALDLGVNLFDTANVYGLGLSEERLARALDNTSEGCSNSHKGWRGLER